MSDDFWEGAEIIGAYSRRQAIEDGILVQLSGPGYQGRPVGSGNGGRGRFPLSGGHDCHGVY